MMADEMEFEAWYAEVAADVTARITAALDNPLLAKEAAAEAFARAYEKWNRVQYMESPEGWVYQTARNLCRNIWRRRRIEQRALAKFGTAEIELLIEPYDVDNLVSGHDAADIEARVQQLPPRMRRAVRLRYWHHMTEAMVAREMNISTGAASSLLSQARHRLRSDLDHAHRSPRPKQNSGRGSSS